MKLNRKTSFVLVSLLLMLAEKPASAQSTNRPTGVTILSETGGATVRLEGAFTFIGKTPFTVAQKLAGPYKLMAAKRGYETKTIDLDFGRDPLRQITIDLQPLSLAKASFYSLVLPGAGQRYKGASGKGLFFTTLALGASVRAYVKHRDYNDDLDAAKNAEKIYLGISAMNAADKQLAFEKWQKAQDNVAGAFKTRRRAVMLAGIVWTINVLDALIMPPGPGRETKKEKIGVSVTNRAGEIPELGLSIKF